MQSMPTDVAPHSASLWINVTTPAAASALTDRPRADFAARNIRRPNLRNTGSGSVPFDR
jgi:hypothetical protein